MRILLLCNKSPWPPKDGGAAATLNMIRCLASAKATVWVMTFNTSKHKINIEDVPETIRQTADIQFINLNTGLNIFKILFNFLFTLKPYNISRFRSEQFTRELQKKLKIDFDIVQIEGLSMFHYLPVIRRCSPARVIFRPHNVENRIWRMLAGEENNIIRKIYCMVLSGRILRIEKRFINEVDAIVPISRNDLTWFVSEGLNQPSLVSLPGFTSEEIAGYSESCPKKIFFIGALDWLPNIYGLKWFISKVWPLVILRDPAAELFIAGRNASEKTAESLTGQSIFFKGEVESSQNFIKDKTIMVVPLFSGSGLRMKIIEGMTLGKCIVSTPLAAEGIDYEHNSDILIASEATSFAENILNLLSDSDLRKKLGENAVKNVRKNYNTFVQGEKLIKFYTELTNDN